MTRSDMASAALISVIISTLNRPRSLARCLDALMAGTRLPTEVVVVDQGDSVATHDVLSSRSSSGVAFVHVVLARKGLSASQNLGVERASCPIVSIVDDDCVPDPYWVEFAVRQHEAAAGPLLLGGRVLPLPAIGDRTLPLALRESTDRVVLAADAMPWDLGTGGNFSVTRSSYLQVGGNDERLGTGSPGRAGNDLDLFRRLMRAGAEARFEPELLVRHERATPDEYRSRSWTYGFGVGACIAVWSAEGDRWALRALSAWVKMRVWLLGAAIRRRRSVTDEVRVILGTAQGLWYGRRLGRRSLGDDVEPPVAMADT